MVIDHCGREAAPAATGMYPELTPFSIGAHGLANVD